MVQNTLILNVDDYDPGRYARTKVLKLAGFKVIEAANGLDTVRMTQEHKPRLILLDVNLPDMDGYEVCRKIRADPKTSGITILHISASNVMSDHQIRGLDCGADSYLVEPVDPRVLIATVKAFLRAREAEDALRQSHEELEWFTYRVAHDLNEPLRTITTQVELIERQLAGRLDENTSECMSFVLDAAAHMRSFIEDLLQFAQVTHSDGAIKNLNCETVLGRVIANLDTAVQSSAAQITHDSLPVLEASGALENVFQNLISNAIKYRREGVPPKVHVGAKWIGTAWEFSVRDNGIGVDREDRESLFKVFRRLHGRNVPGHGIGLAVAQKIVTAHGGKIWMESEPGVGSTFFFTIPQPPALSNAKPQPSE